MNTLQSGGWNFCCRLLCAINKSTEIRTNLRLSLSLADPKPRHCLMNKSFMNSRPRASALQVHRRKRVQINTKAWESGREQRSFGFASGVCKHESRFEIQIVVFMCGSASSPSRGVGRRPEQFARQLNSNPANEFLALDVGWKISSELAHGQLQDENRWENPRLTFES